MSRQCTAALTGLAHPLIAATKNYERLANVKTFSTKFLHKLFNTGIKHPNQNLLF